MDLQCYKEKFSVPAELSTVLRCACRIRDRYLGPYVLVFALWEKNTEKSSTKATGPEYQDCALVLKAGRSSLSSGAPLSGRYC